MTTTGQRTPPLEGGRNFRDLGGYEGVGGRRVKWGRVFRSGSLAGLTQADWDSLRAQGVRTLCDFRTTPEREREPFPWLDEPGFTYFKRDYANSSGELRKLLAGETPPSAEAAREAMRLRYVDIPFEQAPSYRRLFDCLRREETPLIFNCSAGKDRAGTAAALVLTALGVNRETVIEDYLLTNQAVDLMTALAAGPGTAPTVTRARSDVARAVLNADQIYIETALDTVDERHGGIEGYLDEVLEIDAAGLAAIREHLLE